MYASTRASSITRCTRLALAAAACLAVASVAPLSTVQAQSSTARSTEFGVLGGLSSTSLTESENGDLGLTGVRAKSKRRNGFQVGAYLRQPLGSTISLQPELHYIQKGVNFEGVAVDANGNTISSGEIGVKLAYVEVPLLFRIDLSPTGTVRPFAVVGPSFAYRVSCVASISSGQASVATDCDKAETDPFETFDAGGIVGGGLATMMGGRNVSVQVRYSRGFTTVTRESADTYSPRNTGLSVLLGIGF